DLLQKTARISKPDPNLAIIKGRRLKKTDVDEQILSRLIPDADDITKALIHGTFKKYEDDDLTIGGFRGWVIETNKDAIALYYDLLDIYKKAKKMLERYIEEIGYYWQKAEEKLSQVDPSDKDKINQLKSDIKEYEHYYNALLQSLTYISNEIELLADKLDNRFGDVDLDEEVDPDIYDLLGALSHYVGLLEDACNDIMGHTFDDYQIVLEDLNKSNIVLPTIKPSVIAKSSIAKQSAGEILLRGKPRTFWINAINKIIDEVNIRLIDEKFLRDLPPEEKKYQDMLVEYKSIMTAIKDKIESLDCTRIYFDPTVAYVIWDKYRGISSGEGRIEFDDQVIEAELNLFRKFDPETITCLPKTEIGIMPGPEPIFETSKSIRKRINYWAAGESFLHIRNRQFWIRAIECLVEDLQKHLNWVEKEKPDDQIHIQTLNEYIDILNYLKSELENLDCDKVFFYPPAAEVINGRYYDTIVFGKFIGKFSVKCLESELRFLRPIKSYPITCLSEAKKSIAKAESIPEPSILARGKSKSFWTNAINRIITSLKDRFFHTEFGIIETKFSADDYRRLLLDYIDTLTDLKSKIESLDCDRIYLHPAIAHIIWDKFSSLTSPGLFSDVEFHPEVLNAELQVIKDHIDETVCIDSATKSIAKSSMPYPEGLPEIKDEFQASQVFYKLDAYRRSIAEQIEQMLRTKDIDPDIRQQALTHLSYYDSKLSDLAFAILEELHHSKVDLTTVNMLLNDYWLALHPYAEIEDFLNAYGYTYQDIALEIASKLSKSHSTLTKSWTPIEKIVRRCYDAPSKWCVYSEKKDPKTGKRKKLGGPYDTKQEALKRLRQIEYFKRVKKARDRPPKSWMDRCIQSVKRKNKNVKDPASLCAWTGY
ncbi:MAG: hypothetical protein DRQ10_08605, partial [Candidatus Hydrothermota bacterium]